MAHKYRHMHGPGFLALRVTPPKCISISTHTQNYILVARLDGAPHVSNATKRLIDIGLLGVRSIKTIEHICFIGVGSPALNSILPAGKQYLKNDKKLENSWYLISTCRSQQYLGVIKSYSRKETCSW